jgi:hypothetical protein
VRRFCFVSILFFLLFLLSGCIKEPVIIINGVSDKQIYPEVKRIAVVEERFTSYSIYLNGEEIKNNELIVEDGEYKLVTHVKFLWMEKQKVLNFVIDKKPPKRPKLKAKFGEVYFKEVKFDLIEEENVSYEIYVNGIKVDIGSSYKEKGNHSVLIKALKNNGLTSKVEHEIEIDDRTYTKKEIDKFVDFIYEENDELGLIKWMNDVEVYIDGKYSEIDRENLISYIKDINKRLPFEFELKKGKRKVESLDESELMKNAMEVYFVPNTTFKDYGFEGTIYDNGTEVIGFAHPTRVYTDGEINETKIYIDSNTSKKERSSTILHEFVHALGLYNHFEKDKESVIYPYSEYNRLKLGNSDKKMIELLYRKDVEPGMSEKELRKVLRERTIR